MKHTILFVLGIFILKLLSAGTPGGIQWKTVLSGSDTLELYDTDGNKINNATIRISGTDLNTTLAGHIWLKSTINKDLENVYVHRIVNQEVTNSYNSICFGVQCYPPFLATTVHPDTVRVGVTNKSFYGDYSPSGNGGLTSITYEFYDSLTFEKPVYAKATIEFLISGLGIEEERLVFKGPFPNPASITATFEYTVPSFTRSAKLIIRNLLGLEVEEFILERGTNRVIVNTSAYPAGIYMYALMIDGKVTFAKKLIVKH